MVQNRKNSSDSEGILRFERNFLSGILETTGAFIIVLDSKGRILRLNRAIEKLTGHTILETVGTFIWDLFLIPEEVENFKAIFEKLTPDIFPYEFQSRLKTRTGGYLWVMWSSTAIIREKAEIEFIITTGIDITALKQAEEKHEQLITELQEALAKVKTLKGLVPICASCKKIRDDKGYWRMVEDYIREHSDAEFSHGLCPPCAQKLYPGYYHEPEEH
jgi:PAS domain S-box-containing protein